MVRYILHRKKNSWSSAILWYCAWWPLPLRYQGEGARMPRGTIDSYRWMQGRFVKNSEKDKSERSIRKARVRFERRSIEGCLALRKTLRKRGSRKEPPNLRHLDRVPHTRMYKHTPPPNGWWWLLIFEQNIVTNIDVSSSVPFEGKSCYARKGTGLNNEDGSESCLK